MKPNFFRQAPAIAVARSFLISSIPAILAISAFASAHVDAADPGVYADGFEGSSLDTFWSLRNQNTTTSLQTAVAHGGAQAVKFATTTYGQKEAQLEHVFSQKHFGRVSVWVRDPLQYIYFSLGLFNTETGQSASIGVQDWDYGTYYSVGGKTTFPRSTGWHQFTIELGESTLRTLIDGQVVYTAGGGLRFDKVVLSMSGPGSTGTVYYDDFLFESWLMPEIGLDLPGGVPFASGGSWDTGVCLVGEPKTFPFTIHNTGEGELSGLAATLEGTHAAEFSANLAQGATVPPGGSVTFDVIAAPATGGSKSATLRITSNDADENPYLVQLSALSLSSADDSDSDGMNDVGDQAEFFRLRQAGSPARNGEGLFRLRNHQRPLHPQPGAGNSRGRSTACSGSRDRHVHPYPWARTIPGSASIRADAHERSGCEPQQRGAP